MNTIKIKEEFTIPGTDTILEAGVTIEILEAKKKCEECGTMYEGEGLLCEACAKKKAEKKEDVLKEQSVGAILDQIERLFDELDNVIVGESLGDLEDMMAAFDSIKMRAIR